MNNKTSTRKRVMTVVATVIVGAIIFAFGITQRHWFDAQYVYLDNGNAAYQIPAMILHRRQSSFTIRA